MAGIPQVGGGAGAGGGLTEAVQGLAKATNKSTGQKAEEAEGKGKGEKGGGLGDANQAISTINDTSGNATENLQQAGGEVAAGAKDALTTEVAQGNPNTTQNQGAGPNQGSDSVNATTGAVPNSTLV